MSINADLSILDKPKSLHWNPSVELPKRTQLAQRMNQLLQILVTPRVFSFDIRKANANEGIHRSDSSF